MGEARRASVPNGEFHLVGRLWTEFANDPNCAAAEAADRIQRLDAENERLREALADCHEEGGPTVRAIASAALLERQ